ncbi:MAG: sigma-54 dependent transcriptional regulator [Albidovulum sp.]
MTSRSILLVEDTPSLQRVYRSALRSAGHEVILANTGAEGLARFRETDPAVVILDLILPDRSGLDIMQELLALRPGTPVIATTANGSTNKAVEAMRAGAHDFLVKPINAQRLLDAVENAIAAGAPAASQSVTASGDFVGSSPAMKEIYGKIASVAKSMATIFITGESGTGKELCATAIHNGSARARGPFVPLNCGAIPSELLESEVFGHVKGSFTGAISDTEGAAALADGGTLFLDEICELDLNLQTKLLRFLQTSTIQPVGALRPRKVNTRIICATNRDPLDAVRRGQFREDLYYRLHVVPIHMPPLRGRGEDIVTIAETTLRQYAAEEGRRFSHLDDEVRAIFTDLPWPGNVRQLLNVMRQIVVMNEGTLVTRAMLPDGLWQGDPALPEAATPPQPAVPTAVPPAVLPAMLPEGLLGHSLAAIERMVIEQTLALHGGSVSKTARVLQVAPSTLYRKIEGWAKTPKP